MTTNPIKHLSDHAPAKGKNLEHPQDYLLFPGIQLSFQRFEADCVSDCHKAENNIIEINYCRDGRVGWNLGENRSIYLGPGDYAIHTKDACSNSIMTFPTGYYEGIAICIDAVKLTQKPPELLLDAGITGKLLLHKFCASGKYSTFPGNSKTEGIFSLFYEVSPSLQLPYYKLKLLELLLYLGSLPESARRELTQFQSEQVETIKKIHKQLTKNLDQRITIEDLSRQYLMNPTTLKAVFKAVYGNSIAAHIKEHRMERAAHLLLSSKDSISQIAKSVGYESPSKFTAAFKEVHQVLPTEYRKYHKSFSQNKPPQ